MLAGRWRLFHKGSSTNFIGTSFYSFICLFCFVSNSVFLSQFSQSNLLKCSIFFLFCFCLPLIFRFLSSSCFPVSNQFAFPVFSLTSNCPLQIDVCLRTLQWVSMPNLLTNPYILDIVLMKYSYSNRSSKKINKVVI